MSTDVKIMPGQAYTRYEIYGDDDRADVSMETNDDLDSGYPSVHSTFNTSFDRRANQTALQRALAYTGESRYGIGHVVEVHVNGEQV